jgi:hypothetical protein
MFSAPWYELEITPGPIGRLGCMRELPVRMWTQTILRAYGSLVMLPICVLDTFG